MCKSKPLCHHVVLGIDHRADGSQIKTAFRALSLVHHPDILATRSDGEKITGEEHMKAIKNAYDTLGDAYLRNQYD
jgi:DnaJ-class molecular chaperone